MRIRSLGMIMVILVLIQSTLQAQIWIPVSPESIPLTGRRDIIPQSYQTYQMNSRSMKELLWTAPMEDLMSGSEEGIVMTVGLADGTADKFRIVEYNTMEPGLKARYPDVRTFRGVSVSNPYRTIRADWTVNGFRAVISDLEGKTYIDPFQRGDIENRVVYFKRDFAREIDWTCGTESEGGLHDPQDEHGRVIGDCEFRKYRLAVATTGEYSNYFDAFSEADVALVLAEVVTAVNRVNDVYEVDFSTRLELIANTDDVFYYTPNSDPYSNGNGSAMLGQNQTTLDNIIGSANYDIGHVFSTGGGGVAYLNSICNNATKAGGVTGQTNPIGDPFYIDYVAHEMGHQFGGNHTQNNPCNRVSGKSMEPGSASTIMGYAGICSPNVQNNSDAYMHGISLQEITTRIAAANCEMILSTANTAPVVANVPNYTIPISTPFVLTASATDANGNPMTYCWEQWDPEWWPQPPKDTSTMGPMFRSFLPTSSPSRYFPRIQDLVNNVNPTWEELPSVSRDMEFRVTVRDLYDGVWGCTDEDNTIITTTASSGPFTITSQNAATTWPETSNQTITWNVANTTAAPVSCANVEIRYSTDGGLTYPTVLLASTPNDGSADITVPVGVTTTARIMVKAVGNVFFDINNANITVNPGVPTFTITLNPSTITECNDGSLQTTVEVGSYLGFTNPVTLSAINLPPGASAVFNPQVVTPGNNSTLTITGLTGLFGTYTPTVRGTSTPGNIDKTLTVTLLSPPSAPALISPANNAEGVVPSPLLDWSAVTGTTLYSYQLATDVNFNNLVLNGTTANDQYQVTIPLAENTLYYLRTRAQNNCGVGNWSSPFSFTTVACYSVLSTDVPKAISASGTPTITSVLSFAQDMTITDVNVITLTGVHTYVDDLVFTLRSPDNTSRVIWNRPCGNHDNFNINFDDSAANSNWPCPPTDGLIYKPSNTLSIFNALQSEGTWTLQVADIADQDGGSLNSWGLKVCGILNCQLTVSQTSGTGAGSLPAALECASPGDTIKLSASLAGQNINIGATPILLEKDVVIIAEGLNTGISCTGTRVFEMAAGTIVELSDLTLVAGTSLTAGAVLNTGTLILNDVMVDRNPVITGATLIRNEPGAQLVINGTSLLNQ